ncbi:hypothetical protein HYH02_015297 [Chlamydomonas schloesseri]|uniref:Uncharacterized protein n=1 Tax=Chlamydomonas schloesseri TaxID=2026947 RepID=A0A835SAF6_9CHLO|nr:hypothetical protein HYH02_015297 [Chlamydomonas schloesseri]|eukprot:KAG2423682.1 hypothetical protein HYH02_015297 [Chlamydomonas schloesseri]
MPAKNNSKSPGSHGPSAGGHGQGGGAAAAGPHAGQASIRQAYDAMGVQQFYASHGARYTNPHEGQIFSALCQLLDSTPAAVWLGLQPPSRGGGGGQHQHAAAEPEEAAELDPDLNQDEDPDGQAAAGGSPGQQPGTSTEGGGACAADGHHVAGSVGYRARTAEEAAAIAAAVTSGLAAPVPLRVLDLACGSGEASACLAAWNQQRPLPAGRSGTGNADAVSAAGAAAAGAGSGGGPAAAAGAGAGAGAAGGGKKAKGRAAAPPPLLPYELRITACDPYTRDAYVARTGRTAESWSFEDIADGCIEDHLCYGGGGGGGGGGGDSCAAAASGCQQGGGAGAGTGAAATAAAAAGAGMDSSGAAGGGNGSGSGSGSGSPAALAAFDLVVCSFALHLCEPSRLYGTLTALARSARWLLILAPHKLPYIRQEYGWRLERWDRVERTHVRLYRSLSVPAAAAVAAEAAVTAAAAAAAAH